MAASTNASTSTPPRAAIVDSVGALLPRGWSDLFRQFAIWLGFVILYQLARGLADRGPAEAIRNAQRVVRLEQHLGGLVDLDVQQRALEVGSGLFYAVNWTYWLAQFAVVTAALLWVYLRRHEAYPWLRNALIVVNTLGLFLYVALPTAPPRLLPGHGFVDTLAEGGVLSQQSAVVELFANPYAAMPSLHAADALIVGVALAILVRHRALRVLFLLWPMWVSFSLIATGNHFWLDIVAGILLAGLGAALTAAIMRSRQDSVA